MTIDRVAVRAYLGNDAAVRSDAQIDSALKAERTLQASACRVPADADTTPAAVAAREALDEALCRRVAVNLAKRAVPLGMQMSDVGAARLTSTDPEVRRLEGPYRKLAVG